MRHHTLTFMLVVCLCGQVCGGAIANTGEVGKTGEALRVPSDDAQNGLQNTHQGSPANNPSETIKQELDSIVTSEDYSQTTTNTHWQKNKTAQYYEESDSNQSLGKWLESLFGDVNMMAISQGLGLIGKSLAILFLLGLLWWLYKTRATWMPWFATFSSSRHAKTPIVSTPIWQAEEGVWTDLPEAAKLAEFLKSLLAQGLWLPALSALYRGTLKEMGVRHQLPIDRHQTEEECAWLLHQSQAGTSERAYFEALITLWRASAYGQKTPQGVAEGDYGDILALIEMWTKLYGQRVMT